MPTRGEAFSFSANVNTYACLSLILSFTLGCALIIWHAAFGNNPIADMLVSSSVAEYNLDK